ncbi:MAG: hypothetical protein AAGD25_05055 [Cyanobacteria bacterium P01_F01_bin.150]
MFNSSRLYRCAAFTVLLGCLGLAHTSIAIATHSLSFGANVSPLAPFAPVDLAQRQKSLSAPIGQASLIGQTSGNDQGEEEFDSDWDEPGTGSVSEMADDLVDFFRWGEPGGSRTSKFCPISPYAFKLEEVRNGPFMVWTDRPLIVWQGDVSQIIVRNLLDNQKMWTYSVQPTDTAVRYAGEELQPGQLYTLTFVGITSDGASTDPLLLERLGSEDRRMIDAELSQLEEQVHSSGATAEELALRRSRFFIQHDLRLLYDSLDALFSVENPSPELAQRLEQIKMTLCESPTE